MPNTTTHGKGTIHIVPDGSTDWVYGTDVDSNDGFPVSGMILTHIKFIPSAANDRLIVREGSVTGTPFFDSGAVTTVNAVEMSFDRETKRPCIETDDCTFGTPGSCRIIFSYA